MTEPARKSNLRKSDPATEPELRTVSSEALLVDGSDVQFRRLIHTLMAVGNSVDVLRSGFARLIGTSASQHELLMMIYRVNDGAGISVGELAALVKLTSAFVATETNKLSVAGLVEKIPDEADRRRVILRLTKIGRTKLAFLSRYQREVNDLLFGAFDHKAFLALSRYLEALLPDSERAGELVTRLADDHQRASEATEPARKKTVRLPG